MFTWGRGNSGQLGHGDNLNTSLPKPLSFFDDDYFISQASAGWSHSAFVSGQLKMKMFCNFTKREIDLTCLFVCVDSGCLFTCGNGSFGQLGHGDNISLTSPAKVSYFVDKSVKMVACGMRHSLVLFAGKTSDTAFTSSSIKVCFLIFDLSCLLQEIKCADSDLGNADSLVSHQTKLRH